MKKLLLSFGVIGAFILYSWHQQNEKANVVIPSSTGTTPAPTSGSNSRQNIVYKDGTYTGDVSDAFYGNMQVAAVISGGKIIDVKFLQYPNDRGESIQINSQSNPILRSEAIQAQSAQVNIVSGATQSSSAFRQSLQSALSKAQS